MNSLTDEYDMYIANQLMGFALQKEKQYEEAVSFLEKSLEFIPDNINIMHQLVDCYVELDDDMKIIKTAEKIIEIDSEDVIAIFWLQNSYIDKFKQTTNQEDYLNAIKFGKKFDELTKSAYANFKLGTIYELGNDWTNVVIYLEKAIQLKKDLSAEDYAEAMIKLATAYKLLKNYKKAIDYALKVIWLPDKTHHAQAYSTLSICYEQKNEFDLAIHYLDQEIKVENNLVTTLFNLADIFDIYLAQGDMDNAKKIMQKVIKISNKQDLAQRTLGGMYFSLGDFETSIEAYTKAYKTAPNNLQKLLALNNLTCAYYMVKDFDNAKKVLKMYCETTIEEYGSIENKFDSCEAKIHIFSFVEAHFYADHEDFYKYVDRFNNTCLCIPCTQCSVCVEELMVKAFVAEKAGDYNEALSFYRQYQDEVRNEAFAKFKIEELEDKLNIKSSKITPKEIKRIKNMFKNLLNR
ncbi:hypothetical protein AN639_12045 [Candidatus Epulonipiscium fishelsonii]|nr:hypothetical protein AN639_12045 [Epulopiscium sp. SCG-B05WGA-EpuloA1]